MVQRVYLEYLGDSIELPLGATIVGRDVGCLLRFNDPAVSRRHLRFIRRHDEVFVEDLRSSNGTLLNGRIVSAPLRVENGDIVVVGSRQITMHISEVDSAAESTLVLKRLQPISEHEQVMRAVTAQMPVALPPSVEGTHQRCPRCGAAVTEFDDECAKCRHRWGSFRPMSVTDVRPNPVVNRRRHDRHPIELSLVYVSPELEIEAVSRDLSVSGVFVCSQVLDPVGTVCQLTILVDGGPPLLMRGIVRRVVEHEQIGGEPIGLGVEFVGVGRHELEWIRRTLARIADGADDAAS